MMIALFKATDRDEINSPNSQLSYCIVDYNDNCINHTHFHINQSGAVSCIKELDYEDLSVPSRGKAGELKLKIKASDHGNSPLYSTVNLTIFVQVKADTMYIHLFFIFCNISSYMFHYIFNVINMYLTKG